MQNKHDAPNFVASGQTLLVDKATQRDLGHVMVGAYQFYPTLS